MVNKKVTLSYPVKVICSSRSCCKGIIFEEVDVITVDVNEDIVWTPTKWKAVNNILLIKARRFRKEVLEENVHSVEVIKGRIIANPYIK